MAKEIQLIKTQVLIKFMNPRIYIYMTRKYDFEEKIVFKYRCFFQENKSEFRKIYMLEFWVHFLKSIDGYWFLLISIVHCYFMMLCG